MAFSKPEFMKQKYALYTWMPDQTEELKSEHSDNCLDSPTTLRKKR